MVFGFGKKRAVKSSATHLGQRKEIQIDEASTILKEIESPLISKIVEEAKKIKNEIKINQEKIKSTILQLESDDLNLDDVDKNLRTVVSRGKDSVVSTIKKETTTDVIEIRRYEDAVTLNGDVSQMLRRMGDVLGLNTRVMHVFARKYADKLKDDIARLAQNRNSLQILVNDYEDFKSKSENILNVGMKIKKLKDETDQRTKRRTDALAEINETQKIMESLEREMASHKSKNEYKEFLEIKKKIDLLENEKTEIKNKINYQFSKISRPLSKYSYVSSFDKQMKKLMEKLLLEPYIVISIQNKAPITEILQAVTKSVLAGNISVKDSQKAVEQIEETINRLDEFLALKDAHSNKIAKLEQDLAIFDSQLLVEKEKELAKARANLSDLESSIKKLESEISENSTLTEKHKHELESALGGLHGTKIVVKL